MTKAATRKVFLLLLPLVLSGCGGEAPAPVDIQATVAAAVVAAVEAVTEPRPTQVLTDAPVDIEGTVVAAVIATVQALSTPTPLPTVTPAPTPSPTPTPPSSPFPSVLKVSASASPDNPLIVQVEVSLNTEAQVYIEYENQSAGRFRTATTAPAAIWHTVPLVRLRPSTTYSYRAYAVDPGGAGSEGPGGEFTTGPLPEALAARPRNTVGECLGV